MSKLFDEILIQEVLREEVVAQKESADQTREDQLDLSILTNRPMVTSYLNGIQNFKRKISSILISGNPEKDSVIDYICQYGNEKGMRVFTPQRGSGAKLSEFGGGEAIVRDKTKTPNAWQVKTADVPADIFKIYTETSEKELDKRARTQGLKVNSGQDQQNKSTQIADITSDVFGAGAQGAYMGNFKT